MRWVGFVAMAASSVVTYGIYRDFRGVATRMQRWGRDYWEPHGYRYTSVRGIRMWFGVFTGIFVALIIVGVLQVL